MALNRTTVNYWVNWTTLLVFAGLSGTGLTLEWGMEDLDERLTVFRLSRHFLKDIHFWFGMAMLAMIAIHLSLHAAWIRAVTLGKAEGAARTRRAMAAVAGALGIVVLYGLLLYSPGGSAGDGGGRRERRREGRELRQAPDSD